MSRLAPLLAFLLLATACRPVQSESDAASLERPTALVESGTSTPVDETDVAVMVPAGLAPGDHEFVLAQGRRNRSYRVHVPAQVLSPPPVVIALHGGGGTGEQFQHENGMDAVADREGFVVVYPEGSGILADRLHTWNSGLNCCGYAFDRDIDDVSFLRMVINDVDTKITVDRGRVYMTGHSNGAMMTYRFAAEAADMVTAIAPVAGALDVEAPELSQAVALLHIHSTNDPRALYDGGVGPPFPGLTRTHTAQPVLQGIQEWAHANGCDPASTVVETTSASSTAAQQRAELSAWDCPDGAAVQHLRLFGTGHGWPGVTVGRYWQRQLGPPTDLINASEEVWAFVSQFNR